MSSRLPIGVETRESVPAMKLFCHQGWTCESLAPALSSWNEAFAFQKTWLTGGVGWAMEFGATSRYCFDYDLCDSRRCGDSCRRCVAGCDCIPRDSLLEFHKRPRSRSTPG